MERLRFTALMTGFVLFIAGGMLLQPKDSAGEQFTIVLRDYAKMNEAVEAVLSEMPAMEQELQSIRSGNGHTEFSNEKTEFRLKVENHLVRQKHSPEFMRSVAEKETSRQIHAIERAKEEYGVSVTDEELKKYINGLLTEYPGKEKKKYAEALGLSLQGLDHQFNRDLYRMDMLWEKLLPMLEKELGYTDESRLKEEFLSRVDE